jgi:PAS domain S-box-containing protein
LVWHSDAGLRDEAVLIFPTILVVGALLLDGRAYILYAATTLVACALLALAQINGITRAYRLRPITIDELMNMQLILAVAASLAGLLARQLRARSAEAQRHIHALALSEERYRNFVEHAPIGIYRTTPDGEVLMVNPAMVHMLGFSSEEELKKRNLERDGYEPDYRRSDFKNLLEKLGEFRGHIVTWRRSDGTPLTVRESAKAVRGPDGAALYYDGLVEDVTEQKTAEAALRRNQEFLTMIAENSPDVFWTLDLETERITYISPSVERLRGFTPAEVKDSPASASVTAESYRMMRDHILKRMDAYRNGDASQRTTTYIVQQPCKNGSIVDTEIVTALLPDAAGCPRELMGVTRDITARKRAAERQAQIEKQIQQAQRLESIGRLAGGVAHDFNNLLMIINGYCETLLGKVPAASVFRDPLEQIRQAGRRAADLTKQLLAFSRRQFIQPRPLDLDKQVHEVARMLRSLLGEDIILHVPVCEEPVVVLADPGQLHQVSMNLAVNARDAMPGGGTLTIRVSAVTLHDSAATELDLPEGEYACLTVTDTGAGMSPETQSRLFEPFFTTKEAGKGTGLGLSTVYGIVRQSHGVIAVASELGKGSTFSIYLPRVFQEPSAEPASQEAAFATAHTGTETLLVVEDELAVRKLAAITLRGKGYEVLEAASAQEALDIVGNLDEPPALVITDVVMPGLDGRELVARLTAQFPALKVLFTSGYTSDVVEEHGVIASGAPFLQKPYSLETLLARVRIELNRK